MDSRKLNDWMQVIGIFAVVASLIFVGMQMKQTQAIALSDAYQSRAATSVEMITANAANENALTAWYVTDAEGLDSLSPEEINAGRQQALAVRLVWDNIYYQYESGFIPEEYWLTSRVNMKSVLSRPFPRSVIDSELDQMRPSLRAVVVKVIAEIDSEKEE